MKHTSGTRTTKSSTFTVPLHDRSGWTRVNYADAPDEIELHNRFLRIGQEYGIAAAKAVSDLHRHDDGANNRNVVVNDGVKGCNVVVNVVANGEMTLAATEERAVKALLRNPRLTASMLAVSLETSPRQAQRILASLKKKVGLKRRGADKNGEWYFESGDSGQ